MVAERLIRLVVSLCADWSGSAPDKGLQPVDTERINKRVSILKGIGMKSKEANRR